MRRYVIAAFAVVAALVQLPSVTQAAVDEADEAAVQLARDWNVSLTEAMDRVGRQDRALDLAVDGERSFGGRFGGVWIDQARQGKIFVGVTGSVPAVEVDRLAAEHGLAGHVVGTTVRYSVNELSTVLDLLGGQVADANRGATVALSVGLDTAANRVRLTFPSDSLLTTAQRQFVAAARDNHGAALQEVRNDQSAQPTSCAFPHCDPPLRGGMAIWSGNGVGCTSGFMAKKPDGTRWVLTAGHCLTEAGFDPWQMWWTRSANGSWRQFGGSVQGAWVGGGRGDYGVISIDNLAVENPQPWIYYKSAYPSYPIKKMAAAPTSVASMFGAYLCTTGQKSGLQCGMVVGAKQTLTYTTGVTVSGMVVATNKMCRGDTGGPVYANNIAYGITSATWLVPNTQCGNAVIFSPVAKAASDLNVQLMLAP